MEIKIRLQLSDVSLKSLVSDFENVEILIFIKVSIMCDLSVVKEFPHMVQ
jgi:hypothetical protein